MMNNIKTYGAAILSMAAWALSFVWVKIAYESFEPITLIFFRLIGASILMVLIGMAFKNIQPIKRGDLHLFLILSFFEPFLYFMGESFGMKHVSSTLGAVIVSTIPLFAPIAGWISVKERVALTNFMGILISLGGVFLITYNFESGFEASGLGVALMFLAVFAAILYTVFLHKLTHHYSGVSIVTYQSIIGMVYFLPVFLLLEWDGFSFNQLSSRSIGALFQLMIFASVLAFLLFTYTVKRIGITKSNAFVNLIPAITYIFAMILLGDALELQKLAGIVIVILGLFVSQFKFKRKLA